MFSSWWIVYAADAVNCCSRRCCTSCQHVLECRCWLHAWREKSEWCSSTYAEQISFFIDFNCISRSYCCIQYDRLLVWYCHLSVTLCILVLGVSVGGWKLYYHVPRRVLPVHLFWPLTGVFLACFHLILSRWVTEDNFLSDTKTIPRRWPIKQKNKKSKIARKRNSVELSWCAIS